MILLILIFTGFVAGLLSGAVGFGGAMILLPVITTFFGVEVGVPASTIAQLMSNMSKMGFGFRNIQWKKVGFFLITAAPLTALGAFAFVIAPKVLLTRLLCIFLIIFAILKWMGKMELPKSKFTMLIGGGITGLINGLLGISGPLASAVFFSLGLSPVAYIASEATAATAMHFIKVLMYGKLNCLNEDIIFYGVSAGIAMMIGNYIAIKTIKHINKTIYKKLVVIVLIIVSIWLFIAVK